MMSGYLKLAAGLRKAADEMRAENQNGWPVLCDIAAEVFESLSAQGEAEAVGVKPLDDDQIMEIIKEVAPWKHEPKLNDLLTYEKSPPLFPQATYDVPSYRAVKFVRAVEQRIRSCLVAAPAPVPDAVEALEVARTHLITLGGNPHPHDVNADQIQIAVLALINAALASNMPVPDGWISIDNAPKIHGHMILAPNRYGVVDTVCWSDAANDCQGGWDDGCYGEDLPPCNPSVWMPVPVLPLAASGEAGR